MYVIGRAFIPNGSQVFQENFSVESSGYGLFAWCRRVILMPHLNVIIEQFWLLPILGDHAKVEINESSSGVCLFLMVERVKRRADRIADDRIQFLHLIVGQVFAVEGFHRVANDHRDVVCQLLIFFLGFRGIVHGIGIRFLDSRDRLEINSAARPRNCCACSCWSGGDSRDNIYAIVVGRTSCPEGRAQRSTT